MLLLIKLSSNTLLLYILINPSRLTRLLDVVVLLKKINSVVKITHHYVERLYVIS